MVDNIRFAWHVIEIDSSDAYLRRDRTLDPLNRKVASTVIVRGDLFHRHVPDGWIDFIINMAFLCPQHSFVICSACPGRMRHYFQIVRRETEEQTAYRFAAAMLHAGLEDTPKEKLPKITWPPANVVIGANRREVQPVARWLESPT